MVNQERRNKLERAVNHVLDCRRQGIEVSVRAMAREFEVKESTLRMRLKGTSQSRVTQSETSSLPPVNLRNVPMNAAEFRVFKKAVDKEVHALGANGTVDKRVTDILNALQNMMGYIHSTAFPDNTAPGERIRQEYEAHVRLASQSSEHQPPPSRPSQGREREREREREPGHSTPLPTRVPVSGSSTDQTTDPSSSSSIPSSSSDLPSSQNLRIDERSAESTAVD